MKPRVSLGVEISVDAIIDVFWRCTETKHREKKLNKPGPSFSGTASRHSLVRTKLVDVGA